MLWIFLLFTEGLWGRREEASTGTVSFVLLSWCVCLFPLFLWSHSEGQCFLRGCSIVGGKAAMPWMIYCSEVLGIELEKLVFRTASVLPYLSLPIQGLQWPLSGRWTWCRVTARVSGQPFHLLQDACSNFHLFTILWTGFEHGGHPERGGQHRSNFYCQETSGLLTLSSHKVWLPPGGKNPITCIS